MRAARVSYFLDATPPSSSFGHSAPVEGAPKRRGGPGPVGTTSGTRTPPATGSVVKPRLRAATATDTRRVYEARRCADHGAGPLPHADVVEGRYSPLCVTLRQQNAHCLKIFLFRHLPGRLAPSPTTSLYEWGSCLPHTGSGPPTHRHRHLPTPGPPNPFSRTRADGRTGVPQRPTTLKVTPATKNQHPDTQTAPVLPTGEAEVRRNDVHPSNYSGAHFRPLGSTVPTITIVGRGQGPDARKAELGREGGQTRGQNVTVTTQPQTHRVGPNYTCRVR